MSRGSERYHQLEDLFKQRLEEFKAEAREQGLLLSGEEVKSQLVLSYAAPAAYNSPTAANEKLRDQIRFLSYATSERWVGHGLSPLTLSKLRRAIEKISGGNSLGPTLGDLRRLSTEELLIYFEMRGGVGRKTREELLRFMEKEKLRAE